MSDDKKVASFVATVANWNFSLSSNANMPCPAWFVTSTDEKKLANMKLQYQNVEVQVSSEKINVRIPFLVNSKVLKPGTYLRVFAESSPNVTVEPSAKKLKLSM